MSKMSMVPSALWSAQGSYDGSVWLLVVAIMNSIAVRQKVSRTVMIMSFLIENHHFSS